MLKLLITALTCLACLPLHAASPRVTPMVELIRQVEPAVVPIFVPHENGMTTGAGSIIHEDGFILTADHVVREQDRGLVLLNGQRVEYRVIGRLPEKDAALLRVKANRPLPRLELGRSDDLQRGEPILVAGNPGGRGTTFTSGIVSSPDIVINAANALVMTYFPDSAREKFILFDAASNKGNSGGPLINAEGRQVGVVTGKFFTEENNNYATPIDRVRKHFAVMAAVEERGNFWAGLELDTLAAKALVQQVQSKSPADAAGLRTGDTLVSINGKSIRTGVDALMLLTDHKAGDRLAIEFERGGERKQATLTLGEYPLAEPVSKQGKKPGLRYTIYHEQLKALPDFRQLKSAGNGTTETLETEKLASGRKEHYAVVFEGYLEFPASGLHRVALVSDDGSRLFLDGRLAIDNDLNHPPQELGRWVRVKAGLHAIRLEYYQAVSGTALELWIESEKLERKPAVFHRD